MRESAYNVWVEYESHNFVYSGVSGSLLRISTDDYLELGRYLKSGSSACSPELLEQLVRGRMLIADELDESELLRRRYKTAQSDKGSLSLTLVPSLGCNFDCPYCFEDKHLSVMDERVQAAVLRMVDAKLPEINQLVITWFGGEPLVGKKALLRLSNALIGRCDQARARYEASIITNGYLLTKQTCQQLKDVRITSAQVTIDGPPEVHDRMRPLLSGAGTFWKIIENLHHAVQYLSVGVRVNLDAQNANEAEYLLRILASEGFSGKLSVYPGHIVNTRDGRSAPSTAYEAPCFTKAEFARTELEFVGLAQRYGFRRTSVPSPRGTPCAAARVNTLVIGSEGELYKCWESVGNPNEAIGHVANFEEAISQHNKWLSYDPFSNAECRYCIALPVCMGGCAHHAMDALHYEKRCDTFRHTFRERVLDFVQRAEKESVHVTAPAG